MSHEILTGTGVSQGIGIGKAIIINEPSFKLSDSKYTTADNEKERLTSATDKLIERTKLLYNEMKTNAGEENAEILSGHIEILRDPAFISQTDIYIESGMTAEEAADKVFSSYTEMLLASDDEYTRRRASDIGDVRNELLSILFGVETADLSAIPSGSVLVARDFTPSMTSKMNADHVEGIISEVGGVTSHSAILARAMQIPAVLSVTAATSKIENGSTVITDGEAGKIIVNPTIEELEDYKNKKAKFETERESAKQFRNAPTMTKNGLKKAVYANIGTADEVQSVIQNGGDGIGLFRTEFLFMNRRNEPTEDEQLEAYSAAAKAMNGKEIIIRTLDIGGDKHIPYLSIEKEENPFLGKRAIRYCLSNKPLFKRQLRAILRAAEAGNIKIMLPMITSIDEFEQSLAIIRECEEELKNEKIKFKSVPIGVMIETPAAVLISDELAEASDFFSIGTNDLTGYIMCADRGNSGVSHLYNTMEIPVLRAIEKVIKSAAKAGISVGMCGEGAANKQLIPLLLKWGLDEFSVSPPAIPEVRKLISEYEA